MKILFALLGLSLCASCSYRVADFTKCSTKNIDINRPNAYITETNERTKGVENSHIIFFFPTKPYISWKEPVDKAIEARGSKCLGLSNVAVNYVDWYIPFIYGQKSVIVEGGSYL